MLKNIFVLILVLVVTTSGAAQEKPLPVDQAFKLSGSVNNSSLITLNWRIAPDYYLYKNKLSYQIVNPNSISLGEVTLPLAIHKQDHIFGKYEIYQKELQVQIPLNNPSKVNILNLQVSYQGCSAHGFCYPPQTKQIKFNLKKTKQTETPLLQNSSKNSKRITGQDKVSNLLAKSSLWLIIISFFGFGLLLALTPCVLPMIPILSGIIIGHKHRVTTKKAFLLSTIYVLSMAVTYAVIGVIAGLAGQSIQAALQSPFVIGAFSGIFVLLALSLFGLFELKLPSYFESRISDLSNEQHRGTYWGVAVMGVLATLIVSPCVTAPLIGALTYIAKTGDALVGGIALFSMGLGMGIPLILIGTSYSRFLPRADQWMNSVKYFLGVILLATAIWMLSRIIPGSVTLLLSGTLLLFSAIYLGLFNPHKLNGWGNFWRGLGLVFAVYGVILMIGGASGHTKLLQPLHNDDNTCQQPATFSNQHAKFIEIESITALRDFFANHENSNSITLLDFYADWCITCKKIDTEVFSDPGVLGSLQSLNLARADVTAKSPLDKQLQKKLGVIAPPAILFFDKNGNELKNYRIVGDISKENFLKHLKHVQLNN